MNRLKQKIDIDIGTRNTLTRLDYAKGVLTLKHAELNSLWALYEILLQRYGHLNAEVFKRRMQILSAPYKIEGDEDAVEFIKHYLKHIPFSSLLTDLSLAIPYGFCVIEQVYGSFSYKNKAYIAPMRFYGIHPTYIEYREQRDRQDTYIIRDKNATEIDISEHKQKFIFHLHPSDTGTLIESALMYKCSYTSLIALCVMGLEMQYFDILGIPPIVIQHDADKDALRHILNQASHLRSSSVGVFPKETDLKLLEQSSSRGDFSACIKRCNDAISLVVLGNTLGGNTDKGSYALGKIHDGRRKDFLNYDCKILEPTINKLLESVLKINFTEQKEIIFSFDTNDESDEEMLSKVYANLINAGYDIPTEHMRDTFKITDIKKKPYDSEQANIYLSLMNMGYEIPEQKIKEVFGIEFKTQKEPNSKTQKKPITKLDKELSALEYKDILTHFNQFLEQFESFEECLEFLEQRFKGEELLSLEEELGKHVLNGMLYV